MLQECAYTSEAILWVEQVDNQPRRCCKGALKLIEQHYGWKKWSIIWEEAARVRRS